MDWNNIISFIAGGLIAIIPVIISNRYQAKEKDKDREEQRREAKIKAKEKWIERDILQLMDLIEKLVNLYTEAKLFGVRMEFLTKEGRAVLLAQTEPVAELIEMYEKNNDLYRQIHQVGDRIHTLSRSFIDSEIYEMSSDLFGMMINLPSKENEALNWASLADKAGKLHEVLRNKLISIRE